MYFLVFGTDNPGMEPVRQSMHPAHREYLRHPGDHAVVMRLGGPLWAATVSP